MSERQLKYVQTLADLGGGQKYVDFDTHRSALGWREVDYIRVTAELERGGIVDAGWTLEPKVTLTDKGRAAL